VSARADLLELTEAPGAFQRIEDWLRARGFFSPGGERLCAALYLGYALSEPLRRTPTPAPPEPCSLPLAACALIGPGMTRPPVDDGALALGRWDETWSEGAYLGAVEAVRDAIASGDVYQVNLVQHLSAEFSGDPEALGARLATLRPRETRVFHGVGWSIASASPELFLARHGERVWTGPIKGTRPMGGASELERSSKDAAEHVMIVDLERNDLSRVCLPGTVRWSERMVARELAGVEHLVSTVEGALQPGVGLAELLAAVFPGGSVTGAPKIAALDLIAALEPVGRGAAMGALGRVWGNGDLDLTLTIRTFAIADGRIHLWVGGGIVWDSDPLGEIEESRTKARPLLAAIGAPLQHGVRL
jgi:para-aminobenzoate synthetase component 1